MVRRVTPSQLQSMIRQAQQKQQRAINEYNSAIRRHNTAVRQAVNNYNRAIDAYNREARAHNARVAANRRRLASALERLGSGRVVVRSTTYFTSVRTLQTRYEEVERAAPGTWLESRDDILDLAQAEASNSIALAEAADGGSQPPEQPLTDPQVEGRLNQFSLDLAARWRGAIFSLNPQNPDAARHFSSSCREILSRIIDDEATDEDVLRANPQAPLYEGRPTRRAKLAHCLVRAGRASDELAAFADADVAEVIQLFQVFNDGTHGSAGVFDIRHLALIRRRVEGAITFLHSVLRS